MTSVRALGVAAALLLAAAAFAYPNLNAATGIMAVPTAYVTAPGSFSAAADVLFLDSTTVALRGLVGITPRLEAGGLATFGEDTGIGISAKYQVPGSLGSFAVAFGGTFTAANHDHNGSQFYLVGSRPFSTGAAAHLVGTIGLSFTDQTNSSVVRPFLGAQLGFPGNTELAAEFVSEAGNVFNNSVLSLVLRRQISPTFSGEIGFTNSTGFSGTNDHGLFLGIAWGPGRMPPPRR